MLLFLLLFLCASIEVRRESKYITQKELKKGTDNMHIYIVLASQIEFTVM